MDGKEIYILQDKLLLLGFIFEGESFWTDTRRIYYKPITNGKVRHYLNVHTIKDIEEESYVDIFYNNDVISTGIKNKKEALNTILSLIMEYSYEL